MTTRQDVDAIIDQGGVGPYQLWVIALCGLAMFLDGLDVNMMTFLVPTLSAEWGISREDLSFVFTAGLLSAAIASIVNGPVADRWGRRNLMVAYTAIFGLFTLAGAFAQNVEQFVLFRFIAGIGLGGALPNGIALGVEYVPARHRSFTAVVFVSLYGLGQSAGGFLTAALLEDHGWRFIVGLGGALACGLFLLLLLALPESIRFLAQKPENRARVARILRRMRPNWSDDGQSTLASEPSHRGSSPIRAIFADGRAPVTITLLAIIGLNNAQITFLLFWLPNIVTASGLPVGAAVSIVSTCILAGIAGSLLLGHFADRVGHYLILLCTNTLAVIALVGFGGVLGDLPAMMVAAAAIGIGINGFQALANSLAASFYPTSIRATGSGTTFAFGRLCGVFGPIIGTVFFSLGVSTETFFLLDAVLVSLCSLFLLATWRHRVRGSSRRPAPAR